MTFQSGDVVLLVGFLRGGLPESISTLRFPRVDFWGSSNVLTADSLPLGTKAVLVSQSFGNSIFEQAERLADGQEVPVVSLRSELEVRDWLAQEGLWQAVPREAKIRAREKGPSTIKDLVLALATKDNSRKSLPAEATRICEKIEAQSGERPNQKTVLCYLQELRAHKEARAQRRT